jgi:hypothetical protein
MAKTYLDILNAALLDANEVQLTSTTFLSARGIQAFAKEAVNRALMDIANESSEWEWLKGDTAASTTEVTTVEDDQWYQFAATAPLKVDFDTFYLKNSDDLNQRLSRVTYQEWDNLYRNLDEPTDAKGIPLYVIELDEKNQFGLSPIPDGVYTVSFNSWDYATLLVNAADPIPFSDQYYNVLVSKVRYYLWDFKDDQNKASRAGKDYRYALNRMRDNNTTPEPTRMRYM